jgi:peptidoglycan/xylan/chitin deacetylase (PgdA/CDA1 family)
MERLAASVHYQRRMDEARRPMTAGEISSLSANDLIDIGCHTVSHTRLSRLSPQHQREEISAARDRIEEIVGGPVRAHFHPYGDFDESADRIVRELGFAAACTTIPCPIQADSDALRLPRFVIGNWNRGAFGRCLEDFFFGERPA